MKLIDDLIEFAFELRELIEEDWNKFKKFIKDNKKYSTWLLILLVLLGFTDVMTLGSSWDRYCKVNRIQTGGANAPPANAPAANTKKTDETPAANTKKTGETPAANTKKTGETTEANTKQTGEEGDNDAKAKKGESDELKKTDGWLSKLKGEAGKSTGKLGPVFGNMDRIFSYIKNVFYIITVILAIIGIISIPVLIFLVLTYVVFKKMMGSLMIL
uniref:Uncharacterized protein n=1 Tax=viral metagenome TaxID=1070528 RepID=A0A6C0EY33_9ZZZZ